MGSAVIACVYGASRGDAICGLKPGDSQEPTECAFPGDHHPIIDLRPCASRNALSNDSESLA